MTRSKITSKTNDNNQIPEAQNEAELIAARLNDKEVTLVKKMPDFSNVSKIKKWLVIASKVIIASAIIGIFAAGAAVSLFATAKQINTPGFAFIYGAIGASCAICAKIMIMRAIRYDMFKYTDRNANDIKTFFFFFTKKLPSLIWHYAKEEWYKIDQNPYLNNEFVNATSAAARATDDVKPNRLDTASQTHNPLNAQN